MESLLQMGGYVVSVLAAAAIVAVMEALNGRNPYPTAGSGEPVPLPVVSTRRAGNGRLRQ
jgi:hypothetical protein